MRYVVKCLGLADGRRHPTEGLYLKAYDPEAKAGRGHAQWTRDINAAMTFKDAADAHALWTRIPGNRPRRADGKPNRPLTAYTVDLLPIS